MRKLLYILSFLLLFTTFQNCIVKKDPNWSDYSDNKSLDSLQIKHKNFAIKFFQIFNSEDTNKMKSVCADTIYCNWEQGLDSKLERNSKGIPLSDFLKYYYPNLPKGWPANYLHSTYESINKSDTILTLQFGPKKCFDKCDYPNFNFVKKSGNFKFYNMWQY